MVDIAAYWVGFALTAVLVVLAVRYAYGARKALCCPGCEMHGMMLGMTFGMMSGFIPSTFLVMATGDFFTGVVLSCVVGSVVGLWSGRVFGGALGRMEGVMAGPMGGMMGAMLGQMIRPYNLQLFVPFFFALVAFIMFEISYVVYKVTKAKPGYLKGVAAAVVVATVVASFALNFSLQRSSSTWSHAAAGIPKPENLGDSGEAAAKMEGDVQVISIKATTLGYEPNAFVAVKGVPLRIYFSADKDASCDRETIFPEFEKTVMIPDGGTQATFDVDAKGDYSFHCSMGMFQGKITVK